MQVPRLEDLMREYTARKFELDVHGVYFLRDITDAQAEAFAKAMIILGAARANRPDAPITIYINSGGGSVGAGLAIMEMIARAKREYNVQVDTVVTGYAYSMGAVVAQGGDKRVMGSLSTMMLHGGSILVAGDVEKVFRDYQKLEAQYRKLICDIFACRTGLHDAAWWQRFIYSGRDRFLSAQECLELGLVDEVADSLSILCDQAASARQRRQ